MKHLHHKIPASRGGPNDEWNLVEIGPYKHALEHALDFVLFESAPRFDFRHPAWPLLPADLQSAVLAETSKRMSERVVSEETKKKQSEALKRHRKSFEHRKKLAAAQLGKRHSDATRKKMSATRKGRKLSSKHCKAISKSLIGHSVSEKSRSTARRVAKENFANTNKVKYQCLVTGKISTAGPLTGYQKARGIDPKLRRKID